MAEKLCELKKKGGGGGGSVAVNETINIKTKAVGGTNATVAITSNTNHVLKVNGNETDMFVSGDIIFTEVRERAGITLLGSIRYQSAWKFTLDTDALINGVAYQAGYVLTWGYSTTVDYTITGIGTITFEE